MREVTCHPGRRHKAKGLCESCWRKLPERRAKKADQLRAWRQANPEKVAEHAARLKAKRLAAWYNISLAEFERRLADQGGACAICGDPPRSQGKRAGVLVVDHDHITGAVRGLLCHDCNRHLGYAERLGWLEAAMRYLGPAS